VHRVGLGRERKVLAGMTDVYQTTPTVCFIFKYRPLVVLQAQGIAPPHSIEHSTQGSACHHVIDVDDLDTCIASPGTRHARIRALEDELARLCADHLAECPHPVKTEPDERPAKRIKRAHEMLVEIIDLT